VLRRANALGEAHSDVCVGGLAVARQLATMAPGAAEALVQEGVLEQVDLLLGMLDPIPIELHALLFRPFICCCSFPFLSVVLDGFPPFCICLHTLEVAGALSPRTLEVAGALSPRTLEVAGVPSPRTLEVAGAHSPRTLEVAGALSPRTLTPHYHPLHRTPLQPIPGKSRRRQF
jgi:hypothetical protein